MPPLPSSFAITNPFVLGLGITQAENVDETIKIWLEAVEGKKEQIDAVTNDETIINSVSNQEDNTTEENKDEQ